MAFRHLVTAAAADIDELAHVSNLVYVRWVLDAARAHSTALGWSWPEYERIGAVFVVRRHEVDYLLPTVLGDTVAVETWVAVWRAASCFRSTTLTRQSDGEVVARASTRWAYVGWRDGRPQRIPDELRAVFTEVAA